MSFLSTPEMSLDGLILSCLIAMALICISTRFFTGTQSEKRASIPGSIPIRKIPYWLPWLGHSPQFMKDRLEFLQQLSKNETNGIFVITLNGAEHNIVADPVLAELVLQQPESTLGFIDVYLDTLRRVFGISPQLEDTYRDIWTELVESVSEESPHGTGLSTATDVAIRSLEQNIPDMISFMRSPIDMQPWERVSNVVIVSGQVPIVEIDLMSLTREMMAHATITAIFGQAFLDNNADITHDVCIMDAGVEYLMMGLPRWFPLPVVTRAHLARRRLREQMNQFWTAMDSIADGADIPLWGDMEDVSLMIKQRQLIYKDHGVPAGDREELSILWSLIVNTNSIVFWHLVYILVTPGLADLIRKETKPYVKITKGQSIMGVHETPGLSLSHKALVDSCPLFKSTFYETLRLRGHSTSTRLVKKDTILSIDRERSIALKESQFIDIPHDLHMRNEAYFEEPQKFQPDRFLQRGLNGELTAEPRGTRLFENGLSIFKSRLFSERSCLSFVAGLLALWDIDIVDANLETSYQQHASSITLPTTEIRVRISRAESM